jgi:hypothetical protein
MEMRTLKSNHCDISYYVNDLSLITDTNIHSWIWG